MQMLIESTTSVRDMVMDCIASIDMASFIIVLFIFYLYFQCYGYFSFSHEILKLPLVVLVGAFVHACQKVGQHFVVMEDNVDIYKSSSP
jgi:fatty acid desaturase